MTILQKRVRLAITIFSIAIIGAILIDCDLRVTGFTMFISAILLLITAPLFTEF